MATVEKEEIAAPAALEHGLPFSEAVKVWARVAALSFGGPAGQIAVMHRIIVEEKRWIGEERFLHALNYCTLLPARRRSSLRSISAGCSTRPRAAWSPGRCSSFPVPSQSWIELDLRDLRQCRRGPGAVLRSEVCGSRHRARRGSQDW